MLEKAAYLRLSEARRQEIIEKSMDLYLEYPYKEVTIRKIVERLQINMNTFYRYFASKDDLYLYLYDKIEGKAEERIPPDELFIRLKDADNIWTERENRFLLTFLELPNEVIQRVYFDPNLNLSGHIRDFYRNRLEEKRQKGLLRGDVDSDIAVYMYITVSYNLIQYARTYHLSVEEFMEKKEYIYYSLFEYGVSGKK